MGVRGTISVRSAQPPHPRPPKRERAVKRSSLLPSPPEYRGRGEKKNILDHLTEKPFARLGDEHVPLSTNSSNLFVRIRRGSQAAPPVPAELGHPRRSHAAVELYGQ